jgi:hypothetical protein
MTAKQRKRHGLKALKARVTVQGLTAIDMRTNAAQALVAWRSELLTALGGSEAVTPQRATLLEMCVRTRLYIDHLDAFCMSQASLVNRRKKSVLPVLRERQSLVDSLERLLSRLGLDRVPKPVPSLAEYLESDEYKKAQQDDAVHEARAGEETKP